MAKVLLHSVALEDSRASNWMRGGHALMVESARADRFGIHTVTQDPAEADLILFIELGVQGLFAEMVRHHRFLKQFREKCFIFDQGDFALPFLPGVYASLRRKYYDPARTRTGYYLRIDENPFMGFRPLPSGPPYLAGFVGSVVTHPVRAAIAQLPRERFLIEDTSSFSLKLLMGGEEEQRRRFWSHYADSIASAPFALCPRGRGPGSMRLFEVMRMGRVPVILADEWIYPERIDWQSCSVCVAEKDVAHIPEILERHFRRAPEMALAARREWERYYAPDVRFHWLVEDCLDMRRARRRRESIAGRLVWRRVLDPRVLWKYVISKKQIYKRTGRIVL
jgi:hypothetical protein